MKPCNVLHITAHLGGGVGKALSGLIMHNPPDSHIRHAVICLERPEKSQFVDRVRTNGGEVAICPSHEQLAAAIVQADIVQLEWWNHPATIEALCRAALPAMRLLVWCHISGLHNPIIPRPLIEASHKCLFTSPCSYDAAEISLMPPAVRERLDVVHSAGGFEELPFPEGPSDRPLLAGYLGSLNFAKLHPQYVDFMAAVPDPGFRVRMIGDMVNRDILECQCEQLGRKGLLEFRGYTTDIASELAAIDVFPYLLNPRHYGTSENALLEAMAMGVVPIVLDNPAERCLVKDRETGLVVRTPAEFADAMLWLAKNPGERKRIATAAMTSVRSRFAADKMVDALREHYVQLLSKDRRTISFAEIFGRTPADWFLSCQASSAPFLDGYSEVAIDPFSIHELLERTKGTVFHFQTYFPDDNNIKRMADHLMACVHLSKMTKGSL